MTAGTALKVHGGPSNPAVHEWVPFEWVEPVHGPQVKGEYCVIRTDGATGSLQAGFWRTGPTSPGCEPDGSCHVLYSAPDADETVVILEGSVTVTVTTTGKQYQLEPGSIMSHPKGLDITWDIEGPYLRKFWVLWDSPHANAPQDDVFVGHISDNPAEWQPYSWTEPAEGAQTCGELYFVRERGATGTLMAGVWRSGVGIAGCEPDGKAVVPYTGVLGDETILLLEGEVHVRNDQTGEEYEFKAGDVIGLSSGLHVTWTSKAPFVKKFWVITNENPPS